MNNLTSKELKVFNNMSRRLSPEVSLGTKIQQMITALNNITSGTPANAESATAEFLFANDFAHGAHFVFVKGEVIETSPADIYFISAGGPPPTYLPTGYHLVDVEDHTTKASGTLTIDTQPTSGDVMTIGDKRYIFVPVGTDTADGEISISADLAGAQANIVAAINGTDGVNVAHPLVTAGAFSVANACTIEAIIGGSSSPASECPVSSTFTAVTNIFSGATLSVGVDCPVEDGVAQLAAVINENSSFNLTAEVAADEVTMTVTYPTAGEEGNGLHYQTDLIEESVGEQLSGSFEGGTNGTVASQFAIKVDDEYVYICLAANTVSGTNWRRIAFEDLSSENT